MSPRELDARVVHARLGLMRDLLDDLDAVGPINVDGLRHDRMLRHAVERILTQLVELAVSVNGHVAATVFGKAPADYRSSFDVMESGGILSQELSDRLRRSAGLRNLLAHEYARIDLALVAAAVPAARDDYRQYVRLIVGWLKDK